ncbi:GNAT family N-acetyltransferase [Lacrimispora celerecrescens]|uniref:GNAT family N-acetyltransferase n=1 Tax=Lacrimispora celerecrescens TaxID=29354 RepID=UPI002FE5F0BB
MNEEIDMVHIGYCIGRKWWHKGITTEAFKGIIPFLSEKVDVNVLNPDMIQETQIQGR